jgi:hypothetical protein
MFIGAFLALFWVSIALIGAASASVFIVSMGKLTP